MTAPGGGTVITVTTTAGCAWTAATDRDWIVITAGASGAGTGTVTVSVSAHTGTTARTGTLTVAGQAITIRQDGAIPCAWTLSPEGVSVSHDDHAGSFEVRTAEGCAWTAVANAVWLEVRSGAQGTGDGTVTYVIDRNTATAGRTGTITAGGRLFTVTQAGDAGACQYSVGPVEFSPCMTSPALTATVTTGEACTWSATPDASWITIISLMNGQTGSGSGSVTFQVADNWSPPRTGIVMVRWPTVTAGQNLRVMQAGCAYAVSTTAIAIGSAGGTGRFDVLQQSDPVGCGGPLQNACLWTATSDASWITVSTAMPQTGDNPVS
ncbi:MAG: hypothetical protein NUW22_12455, partial [Acidobacteria bacterium]|nr:hypothetical protein [Acidobacteriota bacterium]